MQAGRSAGEDSVNPRGSQYRKLSFLLCSFWEWPRLYLTVSRLLERALCRPQSLLDRSDLYTDLSVWNTGEPAAFVPLERNEQCDASVDAGIAGLTIACVLPREGKSVIVLEKNSAGQGE